MENLGPQVRDVYAELGLAMGVAQSLERQLVFLIIAAYEPLSGKLTADAYDGLLAKPRWPYSGKGLSWKPSGGSNPKT